MKTKMSTVCFRFAAFLSAMSYAHGYAHSFFYPEHKWLAFIAFSTGFMGACFLLAACVNLAVEEPSGRGK